MAGQRRLFRCLPHTFIALSVLHKQCHKRVVYSGDVLCVWGNGICDNAPQYKIKPHLKPNLPVSLHRLAGCYPFKGISVWLIFQCYVGDVCEKWNSPHFRIMNNIKSFWMYLNHITDEIVSFCCQARCRYFDSLLSKAEHHFSEAKLISILVLVMQECWELLYMSHIVDMMTLLAWSNAEFHIDVCKYFAPWLLNNH